MNVLDLFSGIGGFSLGLERAGMRTVAFCEIDPFARLILAKHWPDVPCYDDVRVLDGRTAVGARAICGGFPCQDASIGQTQWGKRVGIDGARTGLWREIKRLASDLRPEIVVLENVPGLLSAGFGTVLGDLAEIGFDAEWRCLPASSAGLPHRRDRLCIVAYPSGSRLSRPVGGQSILESAEASLAELGDQAAGAWRSLDDALDGLRGGDGLSVAMERRRIKPLGNAIVPQIAEAIGRAIMRASEVSRPPSPEQRLDADMTLFNNARAEAFEEAAQIADPWPGFDVGQKMTEPDQSVIEVRNKIAAAIRALAMPSAQSRTRIIEPIVSAGMRGANKQAHAEHASMLPSPNPRRTSNDPAL